MKYIKLCLIVIITILLTACNNSPGTCKKKGYSGMVYSNRNTDGGSCSMGKLSPSGKSYMTDDGTKLISRYSYLEFK